MYSCSRANAFITKKVSDQTEQRKNNLEESKETAKTGFSLKETISETTHLLRKLHSWCEFMMG